MITITYKLYLVNRKTLNWPRKYESWNSATKTSAIWKATQLKPNKFEDLRRRFEDKKRVKTNKRRKRKSPPMAQKKIHFCSLEAPFPFGR
jgi:hypothetical protein